MATAPGSVPWSAALVERPGRGLLRVRGSDRASWLQGLLTNDVAALTSGQGHYSAWLTPQGRIIADMEVLALDDAVVLDVPPGTAASLTASLDALVFAEDIVLGDESAAWARLGVHGSQACARVAEVAQAPALAGAAAWPEYTHGALANSAGGRVIRSDRLGVPGLELLLPVSEADRWRAALVAGGAQPIDAEAAEAARIATGRAAFPADLGDGVIPLEAGIEHRAISFTKGCYVGQEVVVRVLHRGQGRVARRLMCLEPDERNGLMAGAVLMDGAREVGRLTSLARAGDGRAVALGYLVRDVAEAGREVDAAATDGRRIRVRVGRPAA